jgi:hypothetical protein
MHLSDTQQSTVMHATAQLDRYQRQAFMIALNKLFAGRSEIGDGELYRTLRDLQREHFKYPKAAEVGSKGVPRHGKKKGECRSNF